MHGTSGYIMTRYICQIMQLALIDLAFDFFKARGCQDVPTEDGQMDFEVKDSSTVNGRLYPPSHQKCS
jgi:hypothetical protein